MRWCLGLMLIFLYQSTRADNAVESQYSIFNCPKLNSQEEIDLDKIMGKWYVVEVLEHKADHSVRPVAGSYVVDSCPIVSLRPSEHSSLRLLWTERVGKVEYTFRIPDISRKPGFWITSSLQNGTFPEGQYKQFSGNVHVMKAVASDMVLTFCSGGVDSQLYSLLLSREHTLQKSDKRGVHNLLIRRGLGIVRIRETCVNSGATTTTGPFHSWLLSLSILSLCLFTVSSSSSSSSN